MMWFIMFLFTSIPQDCLKTVKRVHNAWRKPYLSFPNSGSSNVMGFGVMCRADWSHKQDTREPLRIRSSWLVLVRKDRILVLIGLQNRTIAIQYGFQSLI